MKVTQDQDAFDTLQMELVYAIIGSIHRELAGKGLAPAELRDITTSIAFHVCCAVDGSLMMENDGKRVIPMLTFAGYADELISAGSTSWMHEYVHGAADDYFQSQP